jgi:hypothetical protein
MASRRSKPSPLPCRRRARSAVVVDATDTLALPSLKKCRVAERPGVQGVRTARLPDAGSNSVAPPSDDLWWPAFLRGITPLDPKR